MTQLIEITTANRRTLHINPDYLVYVGYEETGQLAVRMIDGIVLPLGGSLDEFLARHPSNIVYTDEATPEDVADDEDIEDETDADAETDADDDEETEDTEAE